MKTILKTLCVTAACVIPLLAPLSAQAGLCGSLVVLNQSDECVEIFVNNQLIGTVHAGETSVFEVENHSHATTIKAFCEEDHDLVGRLHYHGLRDAVRFVVQ
jgi:hypothetical protein